MKDLNIINQYNEKLAAYLFEPSSDIQYMMIICHGFRGAKENGGKIFGFAEKLQKLGMGVLAFDFRGSGRSDGDFADMTLSRQAEDLHHIIDYVHTRFRLPIILLGRSFGGSTVMVGGAKDRRVGGYVFWSTPVFVQQTFAAMLPEDFQLLEQGKTICLKDDAGEFTLKPELLADFNRHNMNAYLQAIGMRPTLVVHARDDETVNPANALHMRERLPNCSLCMIDEAGHRFLEKISEREEITIDWLQRNFKLLA